MRTILSDLRHHDSVLWRRAAQAGVEYGPDFFVQHSPSAIGLLLATLLPEKRAAVIRNLRLIHGRRSFLIEQVDVARVFMNFAHCLTDSFLASAKDDKDAFGRSSGHANYRKAEAVGRGVIVATAHTAGWQSAGSLLKSASTAEVIVVMQRERDPRAQALQDTVRTKSGVRVHNASSPLDALPLLAHLRRNGVVAVQMDRLPQGMRGRAVSFFGRAWMIPEGPLRLAAVSGAPIVTAFTRRLGRLSYELVIGEALELPRKPTPAQLDNVARAMTMQLEDFLRRNPTQWLNFD